MQAVAAEFNTPITAFLARSGPTGAGAAEFRIRWFTPVREVIVSVTNLPLSCFRICWLWCDWVNCESSSMICRVTKQRSDMAGVRINA